MKHSRLVSVASILAGVSLLAGCSAQPWAPSPLPAVPADAALLRQLLPPGPQLVELRASVGDAQTRLNGYVDLGEGDGKGCQLDLQATQSSSSAAPITFFIRRSSQGPTMVRTDAADSSWRDVADPMARFPDLGFLPLLLADGQSPGEGLGDSFCNLSLLGRFFTLVDSRTGRLAPRDTATLQRLRASILDFWLLRYFDAVEASSSERSRVAAQMKDPAFDELASLLDSTLLRLFSDKGRVTLSQERIGLASPNEVSLTLVFDATAERVIEPLPTAGYFALLRASRLADPLASIARPSLR